MVDHEEAQERLDAITDECRKHTTDAAFERNLGRHALAECAIHLNKLGDEAAVIALDACCPFTTFHALGAACLAKSAAAVYRSDLTGTEKWARRASQFTDMREFWLRHVQRKHG